MQNSCVCEADNKYDKNNNINNESLKYSTGISKHKSNNNKTAGKTEIMNENFCCKANRSEFVLRFKKLNATRDTVQKQTAAGSLSLTEISMKLRKAVKFAAAMPMISKDAAEIVALCNCANTCSNNERRVLTTKRKNLPTQRCDLAENVDGADCYKSMAGPQRTQRTRRRGSVLHAWTLLGMTLLILLTFGQQSQALLIDQPTIVGLTNESNNNDNAMYNSSGNSNSNRGKSITTVGDGSAGSSASVSSNGYLDKLDNLERSVAAVLIKVAYGTTSTTKRSIPDNSYVPSLTTVATPLLTTLRYLDKSLHQHQPTNVHHHYELDLERDHALPTSAPNADILKSNSNPTYPNPNRHHSHDRERDRHRHPYNTTHLPSLPNLLKKSNSQLPTVPMYPGDIPSYSPPSRSFFTPPLPPEYQNPFADKPTLRGTNNEGMVPNTGTYIHRRPIPPPSLMPGHERIPFRPPDLAASIGNGNTTTAISAISDTKKLVTSMANGGVQEADRKKALNTPSRINDASEVKNIFHDASAGQTNHQDQATLSNGGDDTTTNKRQEVLPSIRRILSGSNGKKGDIPEVLLKQVTTRPIVSYHQPPSSPVVLIENPAQHNDYNEDGNGGGGSPNSPNINKSKQNNPYDNADNTETQTKTKMSTKASTTDDNGGGGSVAISSTPSAAAAIGEAAATSSYVTTSSSSSSSTSHVKNEPTTATGGGGSASNTGSAAAAAAAAAHATWTIAWNIHVYLSVILFTILAVYSLYKMLTYNKLTHLFSQSYFHCIHLILIIICTTRISYLCYDAYNIHSTFHIFVAELLLNLPATFLTVSFSVLILFLFLKSLNHKNNRYSALIRPLTVIVGCGVHVVLCITLHYVESYTLQNQQLYYQQQQQQQLYYRRQQQQQQQQQQHSSSVHATLLPATSLLATPPAPPRVLTLICQIIYIFVCLSLGLLYLYLYRILKRILRSKSQNYIHGYQNLSYAIHITIATALLFVLLAAVQIFGAISISTARPLIAQGTAEIDWLQWGYQFSLRLIEIAIITLISWVTGLKISSGGSGSVAGMVNGDMRLGQPTGLQAVGGINSAMNNREKHTGGSGGHHHHSNVANFFLPCTSSSSQEQFDTDYPAICNANTNLHTYTMRTGKLIYDDSYQLNALGPGSGQTVPQPPGRHCAEYQLQQPTYQRPYDTGSMHSAVNHNLSEYSGQGTLPNHRYHQLSHDHQHHYQDYMTDATTDHYENPNFDLRGSSSGAGSARSAEPHTHTHNALQKGGKTSASCSTTALSSGGSGGSSSAASQQQMLLLQSDSCYSEPLQENSSYEFNNFERPNFGNNATKQQQQQQQLTNGGGVGDCWPDNRNKATRERKSHMTLDRGGYENPERRSSNSTNSCTSTGGGGGGGRYASYNSFDRGYYNGGVRKSGTLNNIVNSNPMHGRTIAGGGGGGVGGAAVVNSGVGVASAAQRASGVQTLAMTERQHCLQRVGGARSAAAAGRLHEQMFVIEPQQQQQQQQQLQQQKQQQHIQQRRQQQHNNSDDDEEEDDDMISVSNVECTNLINNEFGSTCLTNDNDSANLNADDPLNSISIAAATNTNKTERLRPNLPGLQNQVKSQPQQTQQKLLLSKHSHATSSPHVQSNPIATHQQQQQQLTEHDTGSPVSSNSNSNSVSVSASGSGSASCSSAASESMLVTEQGFLRFRALDDINNAQGVGIHNASIRKQSRVAAAAASGIATNGINC